MQSKLNALSGSTAQGSMDRKLHVAIIMDGNGRWATRQGLSRAAGHRAGVAAVRRTVEHAPLVGIGTLTVYAFSADNWRRPPREVRTVLSLIGAYLRIETARLKKNGVRLEVIGRRDRLPRFLLREIEKCEWATAAGKRLRLRVAVDYSSRDAMARAAVAANALPDGDERPSHERVAEAIHHALAAERGEVDLLIRTGGEKRLSDFLLWESAYAELVFTDRMWPDFGPADLEAALGEFDRRERRFGGVQPIPIDSVGVARGGAR
jgi:undecaprenyl diphosphate synthase